MKRTLYQELKNWKDHPSRQPLIVRGARQVGKTFLIEEFGKQEFTNFHMINFEKKPQMANCFQSLDPCDILKELELQANIHLKEESSLLFLDEIQDCPQALKALRYFSEEMPKLHVIAAGSLLEFVLEDKNFSFPVGRVQIANLGPLTFSEYLHACDKQPLLDLLETAKDGSEISNGVHKILLSLIQEFSQIGGMPGVVSVFQASDSYLEAQRKQSSILDLYALDFGKYSTRYAEHHHLKNLFEKLPNLVGKHFKFSKIDPDCANPARDYRGALHRLAQARLILPVHATQGNGIPLRAEKSEKKFKVFFLDIGLLSLGLDWRGSQTKNENSSSTFQGMSGEQFVAQELNALHDPYIQRGLYFWENSDRSSRAEIDFLINLSNQILPIEVKSGSTGRLKSLRQFMSKKNCPIGIQISEKPLGFTNGVLSVPFYMIGQLPRLVQRFNISA